MNMDAWTVILMGLASFRLTRLIVFDKITEFLRSPFLDEIVEIDENGLEQTYLIAKPSGIRKWLGELLTCYWCTGIWSSIFLVSIYFIFPTAGEIIIVVLSVAAIGSIIETIISKILES